MVFDRIEQPKTHLHADASSKWMQSAMPKSNAFSDAQSLTTQSAQKVVDAQFGTPAFMDSTKDKASDHSAPPKQQLEGPDGKSAPDVSEKSVAPELSKEALEDIATAKRYKESLARGEFSPSDLQPQYKFDFNPAAQNGEQTNESQTR